MILLSPRNDLPTHELDVKDLFNAMIWANSDQYVFSHKADIQIEKLREHAKSFGMFPVLENIQFIAG